MQQTAAATSVSDTRANSMSAFMRSSLPSMSGRSTASSSILSTTHGTSCNQTRCNPRQHALLQQVISTSTQG